MEKEHNLYIIAGPNGAGKTTASFTLLPEFLHCTNFVNADEIAKGISPFAPEEVAFQAGRIMLQRIDELLAQHMDFAIETTLATRSYVNLVKRAHLAGYKVFLAFFYLDSAEQAIARVAQRVSEGGHNIPTDVIRHRYQLGLSNLLNLFMPICDVVYVWDNSQPPARLIVSKQSSIDEPKIEDIVLWNKIKTYE